MASLIGPQYLAATGTTGNNTGAAMNINAEVDAQAVQFVVEAVGATPTVTWKIQGSFDGTNWFDVPYVTDVAGAAANTSLTSTAVGSKIIFIDLPTTRDWPKLRLVTSANTNVTYRCELYTSNALS